MVSFVKLLVMDGLFFKLFFNWYLRLGNQIFDIFNGRVSKILILPRKTYLFGATPTMHK
jgi:hypothetical protein